MLSVDMRRAFKTPTFYIMLGIAFVVPILILVMTSMAGGGDMFGSACDIIAKSGSSGMTDMDLSAMCNINMMYFLNGIYICLFISEDFSSGYCKSIFTVRAKKFDYVISKTIVGFITGVMLLLAFFAGTVIGGAVAGLPMALGIAGTAGLIMCMIAKCFMMGVFVGIFVLMGAIARKNAWLSIMLSLFAGMLLFMMIPLMTPLDSGIINVVMCLAGGALFAAGFGAASAGVLARADLA